MCPRYYLALVFLLFPLTQALSQETAILGFGKSDFDDPISTDRPDFTESVNTIEPGHLQLESGYTFITNDDGGVRVDRHSTPEILARAGMTESFELRLVWIGYTFEEQRQSGSQISVAEGGSDLSVGLKARVLEQEGFVPHLSFIFASTVPSGASAVRAESMQPELKVLWAYDLENSWAVSGNINFSSPIEEGDRFFAPSESLSLGRPLTDTLGYYVEYFGLFALDAPDSRAQNYLNGGFTYLLAPSIQLDIRTGFGINEAADDFFTGIGISWRV